jgi:hypothetical protein
MVMTEDGQVLTAGDGSNWVHADATPENRFCF